MGCIGTLRQIRDDPSPDQNSVLDRINVTLFKFLFKYETNLRKVNHVLKKVTLTIVEISQVGLHFNLFGWVILSKRLIIQVKNCQ